MWPKSIMYCIYYAERLVLALNIEYVSPSPNRQMVHESEVYAWIYLWTLSLSNLLILFSFFFCISPVPIYSCVSGLCVCVCRLLWRYPKFKPIHPLNLLSHATVISICISIIFMYIASVRCVRLCLFIYMFICCSHCHIWNVKSIWPDGLPCRNIFCT